MTHFGTGPPECDVKSFQIKIIQTSYLAWPTILISILLVWVKGKNLFVLKYSARIMMVPLGRLSDVKAEICELILVTVSFVSP